MDVAATGTTRPATSTTAANAAAGKISADYDTFLKMLTTQMRYQDPLNPIESSDYAVQLATFSGVEAQTRTNQLLESVVARLGAQGMADLAGWVGQEARAEMPVHFDGAPVDLALPVEPAADRAVLAVRDAAGQVVAREDVAPGAGSHRWLGAGITGEPVATGLYRFELESHAGERAISTRAVAAYAAIAEVRMTETGAEAVFPGGVAVPAEAITALRRAGG